MTLNNILNYARNPLVVITAIFVVGITGMLGYAVYKELTNNPVVQHVAGE